MKNLFTLTLPKVFRLTLEQGKINGCRYYFIIKHLFDEVEYSYEPTCVIEMIYNRDEAILKMQEIFESLKVQL